MRRQDAVPLTLLCTALLACAPVAPAPSPARVAISAVSPAPAAQATARAAAAPDQPQLFAFRSGKAEDELGAYATRYWGPNGRSVFTNAATSSEGDVAGGPEPERLLAVGQYAVVELPERRGYYVRDLGERGWVTSIDAAELTDTLRDVLLRYKLADPPASSDTEQNVTSTAHFVIEIWSFRGAAPARLFAHEHEAWANCCGSEIGLAPPRVDDDVEIRRGRITLRAGKAWRANASTFHPRALEGIPPLLTPWGEVASRVFVWDGRAFAPASESD